MVIGTTTPWEVALVPTATQAVAVGQAMPNSPRSAPATGWTAPATPSTMGTITAVGFGPVDRPTARQVVALVHAILSSWYEPDTT